LAGIGQDRVYGCVDAMDERSVNTHEISVDRGISSGKFIFEPVPTRVDASWCIL